MKIKIFMIALSGILQIGGAVAIGYYTAWQVGVAVVCVIWGHNLEKHQKRR